jgi:hypothetical protein
MNTTKTAATDMVSTIFHSGAHPITQMLALMGVVYLIQMVATTGVNLIYVFAYIIGFFKWIYIKVRMKI